VNTPSVNINSEVMQSLVAKAIIDSIEPEQKQLLLEQALAWIVAPRIEYGRQVNDSPLQQAFTQAVREAAVVAVRELVAEAPIKAAIEEKVREKVTVLLAEEQSWLFDSVGNAVGERITEIMRGHV
jgi:hypothetical protein